MKHIQDFPGVKFTTRGWSISSRSAGNVGYLSRALSQAIAFIPSSMGAVVEGTLEKLVDSQMIVVKNIEEAGDDIILLLQDVPAAESVSVMLKGQAGKRLALTVGTIVKMRSVSTGYVLLLGGTTLSLINNNSNQAPSILY